MELIKDVPSAIKYLGQKDKEVKLYKKMQKAKMPPYYLAEQRCVIFCRALNEKKSLNDVTYIPWFDRTKKPGSGFFYGGSSCYYWDDYAVSVRVAHATSDRAIFGAKTFEKIYYPHITGKKLPE